MINHAEAPPARVPLSSLPPRDWSEAALTLDTDGVVHLPAALTPEALAKVEAAVAFSLANPTPTAVNFYPDEQAKFFEDRGKRHLNLVRETGLDSMVAALWGEDCFWYLGEQLFVKEGGHSRRTPWHQDTPYLRMKGSQLIACWISLDRLPKDHCLEFVRGSHTGTLYNGSAFAADDDTAPLHKHSALPRLPDIQARRGDFDILSWDIEPGDLIFFHLGMLHGGAGTRPGMRRRTVSLRFLGPDVRFDGRGWSGRGPKVGDYSGRAPVYDDLADGDPYPTAHLDQV